MKASIISLLTILSASLLIATPAKSETLLVGSTEDSEEKYYLDTNSIAFDRNFVQASVKVKHKNPIRNGVSTSVSRWKVNCSYRSMMIIEGTSYDSNGRFLGSSRKPTGWSEVALGSVGEYVYRTHLAS